ncbi:hypothetical protein L345_10165, partial [Ophiophagus hannah]
MIPFSSHPFNMGFSSRTPALRRQPFSTPLLFIMVIEDIVTASLPNIVAYADDLVLFAEKSPQLQEKLHLLSKALTQAGMALNAKKSRGLTITRDGKRKCVTLLPTTFECEGGNINPLGPGDSAFEMQAESEIPFHIGKTPHLQMLQRLSRKVTLRVTESYVHPLFQNHFHNSVLRVSNDALVQLNERPSHRETPPVTSCFPSPNQRWSCFSSSSGTMQPESHGASEAALIQLKSARLGPAAREQQHARGLVSKTIYFKRKTTSCN